jgi:hypothetical protein
MLPLRRATSDRLQGARKDRRVLYALPLPKHSPIRCYKEEMRRGHEAQTLFGGGRPWVLDVEVEEVHLVTVLPLEPMHDGHHGATAESSMVKELDELRPSCGGDAGRVAGFVPAAVLGGRGRRATCFSPQQQHTDPNRSRCGDSASDEPAEDVTFH